jgi:hypothetical protein
MLVRRLIATTSALLLAVGVAACGNHEEQGVEEPAREGIAVEMGGVDYNVFITRQLNPAVQPDGAYYAGPPTKPGEVLYGVFLQTCNRSNEPRDTATTFKATDNQGNEFDPTPLPEDNQFAYSAQRLDPDECIPEAGSVAQLGPTAASMVLFTFPLEQTENRPIELEIENPSDEGPDHITYTLDL